MSEAVLPGADPGRRPIERWRAWATLALLGALYFMSFVDRLILALLVEPLRQDLGVSNLQLGLLFGTAFALFYGVLGLPLARLADRFDRRKLIIAGVFLWSLSTIGSGFSTTFLALIIFRIGLAVGEAALSPSAYSMIGDLFPPEYRNRAASIYSAAGMLGSGGSYILGAALIGYLEVRLVDGALWGFRIWELVFFAVGIPALLIGLLFALIAREPPRMEDGAKGPVPSLPEVFGIIWSKFRIYGFMIIGAGMCQIPGYALVAWLPTYLGSRFGYSVEQAGYLLGPVKLFASTLGSLLVPIIAELVARRTRPSATALCGGIAAGIGAAAIAAAGTATTAGMFVPLIAVGLFMLSGTTTTVIASFQLTVTGRMRATMSALCLMSITLLGLGIGPTALGAMTGSAWADHMPGIGIVTVALIGALPGALLLFAAAYAGRATPRQTVST